jgi:hypothetical protein
MEGERPWTLFPGQYGKDQTPPARTPPAVRLQNLTPDIAKHYHGYMEKDQGGMATMCFDDRDNSVVAVKREQKTAHGNILDFRKIKQDNVLYIKLALTAGENILFFHEEVPSTLRHLKVTWSRTGDKLAIICQQVRTTNFGHGRLLTRSKLLEGVSYIHHRLNLCCRSLDCGTVVLNQEAKVKIGKEMRTPSASSNQQ